MLADGSSTSSGEIALGKNCLVAFMSWEGYNFEDAIILSERLVKDDELTSIHIEEYEIDARTTKLGDEEITRDIPNRSEESLRNLDERGIVRVGAEVSSGDLLVGKVTPKGETELTAEEKLIRAIFKEKAREVRDTSLKVPHGSGGVVLEVLTFNRDDGDDLQPRGQRPRPGLRRDEAEDPGGRQARRPPRQQGRDLEDRARGGHAAPRRRHPRRRHPQPARRAEPYEHRPDPRDASRLGRGQRLVRRRLGVLRSRCARSRTGGSTWRRRSSTAPPSTDVDNALVQWQKENWDERGIDLGLDESKPEGARRRAAPSSTPAAPASRTRVDVTIGYMYILKLLHLVDDKIHARSTGPYSLVTQQPLGGKAQFGGQRFGEMEVWALEAYGAAYTLQEMLTVKSDDTVGRVKAYESIVKGENIPEPSVPESFKVLLKEMQALSLDANLVTEEGKVGLEEEEDELLRAAEELGIDLSGVRAGDGEAADETQSEEVGRRRERGGGSEDVTHGRSNRDARIYE